jgi:hypothetical protein
MDEWPVSQQPPTITPVVEPTPAKKRKGWVAFLLIVVIIVAAWFLVRPGVFTIQPIGALPEGVTIVYHSRNPEMPFFSSPDSLCLQMQGSVSLLCRGIAIGAADELANRIIIKLPYSKWAYLQSTGGKEFNK